MYAPALIGAALSCSRFGRKGATRTGL